ncbi:MAG: hypothetical protein ABSF44_13575 [Candidatus Bathyarchaeia archaeon]
MKRKSIQEINFSDQVRQRKVAVHKKRMPLVGCTCGFEILVLPDMKAMNRALNNHVAQHNKVRDNSERLTKFLSEQVLVLASKMNLSI